MHRPFLMAALLMAAALAGCLQADDPSDEHLGTPPTGAPATPVFMNGTAAPTTSVLADCYELVGDFAVPADEYADRLPEGFSVRPHSGLGQVPPEPTGMTGELFAVASRCDLEGETMQRILVFLQVDAPSGLVNTQADFGHLFLLSYVTDSPAHVALLHSWGFSGPVVLANVSLTLSDDVVVRTGTLATTFGGSALTLDTVVAGTPVELEGSHARFFAADADGVLTGIADASFGAYDAMFGAAELSGPTTAGVSQDPMGRTGAALHIWGHDNTWSFVEVPAGA